MSGSAQDSDATIATGPRYRIAESPPRTNPPTTGRYVVLESLGMGAMGEVFRAYDPKLRREVALKRLHAHWLNPNSKARFVREARAMAQLSHPNVVAIHDVELEGAGVTLVMEYVRGQTLKEWLAEPRQWQDIVAAFCQAARGLAAAHAVGLVHRDFKPENVLVVCGPTDGSIERVKVADFGLVKTNSDGLDHNEVQDASASVTNAAIGVDQDLATLTEVGTILGTPRYMAPEQHEGDAVGPPADQYALCVALWEALNRCSPFAVYAGDVLRCKRAGPRSWPSQTAVPEAIVAAIERGLAPEPHNRWPGLQELVDALEADRNPPKASSRRIVYAVVAAAIAGAGGSALWMVHAQRGKLCSGAEHDLATTWNDERKAEVQAALVASRADYAEHTAKRVLERLDGQASAWIEQHEQACEATTVRGEQSSAVMDLRMACLHHVKLDLEASVEILRTADTDVLSHAIALVEDMDDVSECADLQGLQRDPSQPDDGRVAALVEAQRAELATARAQLRAGKFSQAWTALEPLDKHVRELGYGPFEAEVALVVGDALKKLGRFKDSVAAYERALSLALRGGPPRVAANAAVDLTFVLGRELGDHTAASWLGKIGKDMARQLEDAALEARAFAAVAVLLSEQGKYAEAQAAYRQSLALDQRGDDPTGLRIARTRSNLAGVWFAQGRYEAAAAEYRAALGLFSNLLGANHPDTLNRRNNLANTLLASGDHAQAEREHRAILQERIKALGPQHPHVATSYNNLGAAQHAQGNYEDAETSQRRALQLRIEIFGAEHGDVADSHSNLGDVYMGRRAYERAEEEYRRALEIRLRVWGPEHPAVGSSQGRLGHVLVALRRPTDALVHLERAWAIGVDAADRAKTAFLLAKALWDVKPLERGRALELAVEAAAGFEEAAAARDAAEVSSWLATRSSTHRLRASAQ